MKNETYDINKVLTEAKKVQEKYNAFVTLIENPKCYNEKGDLSGIPYALKDNFSTKDILTTASSNTLKDYVPFYDATVVKKLKEAGAIMIGKTVMDEFGMGGSGTTGHTGTVKNPWDLTRITAGSSAGSACVVACGLVPFSIGSDTGDSIRKPAAYCGIVGYKPTYGLISRYGLFPFASSLDHVGVLTRNVQDAAVVVDVIKGKDRQDMTSLDSANIHLESHLKDQVKGKKIFTIKEIANLSSYENPSETLKKTLNLFSQTLEKIKALGISVEEVSIDKDLLEAIPATYVCLSSAEATSNMSNLTGIIFGPKGEGKTYLEQIKDHRTKGFSPLIKRRFVIGSYVLKKENQEKYFLNAKRVRHLIVDTIKDLFKTYDALLLPCSEGGAKKIEEQHDAMGKRESVLENHMVIGNFGGFPSITIPNGFVDGLPVGINLTSNVLEDECLLSLAYHIEETLSYKNQVAKEVSKC